MWLGVLVSAPASGKFLVVKFLGEMEVGRVEERGREGGCVGRELGGVRTVLKNMVQ